MENQLEEIIRNPAFSKIVFLIAGFFTIWFLIKIIRNKLFTHIKDNENRYRANKISSFAGYALSILLLSIAFSDKLGGFTVALGVAGAGIAFALQEVIASFAGWLAIMFGNFFKTGDRVQVGGITGDVMDIGVLRTTVMETGDWVNGDLYNGRIVLIANSFVFKEPVYNYSGDFPFLWDEIEIPFQYGGDYEMATTVILAIGKEIVGDLTIQSKEKWNELQLKYRLETAQTEPMVSLVANNEGVVFTLRYVVDYKKRRYTKTALFTKILTEIEKLNGAVKFPSSTVQIIETPEIQANTKE
tara:strand:- start:934 stop:1833 length:900 start_codon:yes stop_codon:yes gene_type:complete